MWFSVIVILQSTEVIDLLKDFTALYVISSIDDIIFSIIRRGFFGTSLLEKAIDVELIEIRGESQFEQVKDDKENDRQENVVEKIVPSSSLPISCGDRFKSILLYFILAVCIISWGIVFVLQEIGIFADQKYPLCKNELGLDWDLFGREWTLLENNNCDMILNNHACGFDGGDCAEFNLFFPECKNMQDAQLIEDVSQLGDGVCDGYPYNTTECGEDGGDCIDFNLMNKLKNLYPNCTIVDPHRIGDGLCDGWPYNTEECGWDGGDCLIEEYPDCHVGKSSNIGDGWCDGFEYNTEECGWDSGDCIEFNDKYPNCKVDSPWRIGDGVCNGGDYNTIECGWDGGDC